MENAINCYVTTNILYKKYAEMFLEWSSTDHVNLFQMSDFVLVVMATVI